MPSKPASAVADACARRANYLVHYTTRMSGRCNSDADRNQVYAGAYVAYLAFFEQQLEDLFIGLLTHKYVHPNTGVKPVVAMPNAKAAKSLITGGRSYVDWLPYDQHTRKRATAFLLEGQPFLGLGKPDRAALERASVLRNALAHQSDHSQRRFKEEFTDGKSLRTGELKPGGYLRGSHSRLKTRFEVQLQELVRVIRELTS
ncbi:hypothetical protein [Nocardioides mangrovi]|uniref:RiboL-PSP-HEPN domain-containing protein n=1 Tax=Nocardioides mangrovi TaxID=2874580 RepID=A0ABS7UHH7_9ACTN|nr:hypothetical protein [Nocardioides mangrovi]MBZ5740332.1 hypothetical protein [Nocardioides mangrovi]